MAERTPRNISEDQKQRRHELRDAVKNLEGKIGLVLERHPEEAIIIAPGIVVRVLSIEGGRVMLGIKAPRENLIIREELLYADSPQIEPNPTLQ